MYPRHYGGLQVDCAEWPYLCTAMTSSIYEIILGFITAFVVVVLAIPQIIRFAVRFRLYDLPDERKSHVEIVPALGGIALSGGLFLSMLLWTPGPDMDQVKYLLGAMMILFLVGAKDDIDPVSPLVKLSAQLLAGLILCHLAGVRLTSLYGLLGIYELDYVPSLVVSVFTILVITNSFNLIDGINGLLGLISSVALLCFGGWFYLAGHVGMAIVAFSTLGGIIAFLKYNLTPAQIFMGDTGSLLVGVVCSICALQFIELSAGLPAASAYKIESAPVVAAGLLLLPLMDTLRVFVMRVLKGQSPLHPDRRHMHHILIRTGLSHISASLLLMSVSVILSVFFLTCHQLPTSLLMIIILGAALLFAALLEVLYAKQQL